MISRASVHVVFVLATVGLILGTWQTLGWGLAAGFAVVLWLLWAADRREARERRRQQRAALREQAWLRMGGRRGADWL